MDESRGTALAQLLLLSFNTMVVEVVAELERRGHPGVTANHAFALSAIDGGAQSASDLARSLGVSRQAAAKSIATLEGLAYLERRSDPLDARRKPLLVTPRGHEMLSIGAEKFADVRTQLLTQVGSTRFEAFESVLTVLTGDSRDAGS